MNNVANKFNDLKRELFLIRRLLEEGYGPRYWWPYVKNRFFGNYLFRRLSRYDYVADLDLEMHTICQKKDIWMLASMLHSFFYFSKLRPRVIIHDDGSFDQASAELVESKFANTEVWLLKERTEKVMAISDLPDIVRKARIEGHKFLYRPIDVLALSNAKKLIFHDTDILYYKPPTELVDFINGKMDCDALVQKINIGSFDVMTDEYYNQKYNLEEKQVKYINGGYVILNREKFKMDQMVEYLEHSKRLSKDYFSEMSFFACVLSQLNFKFLPLERYAIKGFLNDKMVMKHYTSPRRYEMFAYGIDKAKDAIESEENRI